MSECSCESLQHFLLSLYPADALKRARTWQRSCLHEHIHFVPPG